MTEHETSIFMTGVKTLNNRFHAALACYPSMASSVRAQWHPHCGRWVETAQALATESWPSWNPAFLVFKIFRFWVIAAQNKLFRVKSGESTPKKDSCRILGTGKSRGRPVLHYLPEEYEVMDATHPMPGWASRTSHPHSVLPSTLSALLQSSLTGKANHQD